MTSGVHQLEPVEPNKGLSSQLLLPTKGKTMPLFSRLPRPALRWLVVPANAIALAALFANPAFTEGATFAPDPVNVLGFGIEAEGAEPDWFWETVTGGSLNIDTQDIADQSNAGRINPRRLSFVETLVLRGPPMARGALVGTSEPLEDGAGRFSLAVDGVSFDNVVSITIEDLVIEAEESTAGRNSDSGFREYTPGEIDYGNLTFRAWADSGNDLHQWWLDGSRGEDVQKSVSVVAVARDESEARRYDFWGCSPVRYQPFVLSTLPTPAQEELEVSCEGVAFWDSGPRKYLMEWLNATLDDWDASRNLTIQYFLTDGSDGKKFIYHGAFPTRYVFPDFNAAGTGNLKEEVTIQPNRLDME